MYKPDFKRPVAEQYARARLGKRFKCGLSKSVGEALLNCRHAGARDPGFELVVAMVASAMCLEPVNRD
jgi:hypothetical protein